MAAVVILVELLMTTDLIRYQAGVRWEGPAPRRPAVLARLCQARVKDRAFVSPSELCAGAMTVSKMLDGSYMYKDVIEGFWWNTKMNGVTAPLLCRIRGRL